MFSTLIIEILRKYTPAILRENFFLKKCFIYFHSNLFLIRKLRKQLSGNKLIKKKHNKTLSKKVLIPIIETTHNHYHPILLIAKALEIRGCDVKVIVCNSFLTGCEIKSVKNINDPDPCWDCKFSLKKILHLYDLETIDIKTLCPSSLQNKWIKLIKKKEINYKKIKALLPFSIDEDNFNNIIYDSILRFYFGNVPKESHHYRETKLNHIVTFLVSSYISKRIDELWSPDYVFCNMNVYSTWAPFYRYFSTNGNRFKTISLSAYNTESLVLDHINLYPSKTRYLHFIKSLKNNRLNKKQNSEIEDFLDKRFSGKDKVALDNSYFNNLDLSLIKEKLSFDPTKKNLFLFSNVHWDVGINDMDSIYEDILSWVKRTIEIVANNDSVNLYIKTHPAEYFDKSSSLKGVANFIREEFGEKLPKNIFLIEPQMKIKPYDLIPLIDIGIFSSSTMGLELMLYGKPIVLTSKKAPFYGLGFANEPKNEKEYELILKSKTDIKYPIINEVKKFAYFWFIKINIPWNLQTSVFGNFFNGFKFSSINELKKGQNKYLDHLCDCLIDNSDKGIENWK